MCCGEKFTVAWSLVGDDLPLRLSKRIDVLAPPKLVSISSLGLINRSI